MKPVLFHPEARQELIAAGSYYAQRSLPVAQRFYAEIDEVISEVRAKPALRRTFDPPARRHSGPIFPYCIVYLERPDSLWVIAVMHFKQEPGYWPHPSGVSNFASDSKSKLECSLFPRPGVLSSTVYSFATTVS